MAYVDVYRAVTMRLDFHDQEWVKAKRKNANPQRYRLTNTDSRMHSNSSLWSGTLPRSQIQS